MALIGVFPLVGDLLHTGHIKAIEEAKQHCTYLIVCLNTQPDGKTPVESVYERFTRLDCNKNIDKIIPYAGEDDLLTLLKTTDYHIRFIGEDHKDDYTGCQYEKDTHKLVHVIKRGHGISSTKLKERVIKREHGCSSTGLNENVKEQK